MINSDLFSVSTTVLASTVAVATLLLLVVWVYQRNNQKPRLKRTFSYTSAAMAIGSYPPEVCAPDTVINATVLFRDCPTQEDVVKTIVPRMLEYKRMSTIPVGIEGTSRPCEGGIDPKKLVRRVEVNGDDKLLFDTVKLHMHDSLSDDDRELPWWEILIIENSKRGQESALIWRVHHSLADGLSMLAVVEQIMKYADGSPMGSLLPPGMAKKFKVKVPWYKLVLNVLSAVVKVLSMPSGNYDDDTVFSKSFHPKMVHSQERELVLFHSMPLDFVKELKTAGKVTINDVLYTCLSEAIHVYLERAECPVLKEKGADLQCRALMPVAFPRPSEVLGDKSETLRNRWCFVSADMGIHFKDILDRLEFVHQHMNEIKHSAVAPVGLKIQNTLPAFLPTSVSQQVVFDTLSRHSIIFSNVPGPPKPVLFAGKEATGVQMVFSNLIPQLGFISYRGLIFGNMCVDAEGVPNCQSISVLFSRAMVELANRLDVKVPDDVAAHAKQEC